MKNNIKHCIIIGSSRGLGAAIVEEFLNEGSYFITGVARGNLEKAPHHEKWVTSKRYRHVELDITSSTCSKCLRSICTELPPEPIYIIFNAALVETDVNRDSSINYKVFQEINRVGVEGLGNVLSGFEDHLLTNGGILVGISSFSALVPPLFEQRVAYPASKAYLDMALRCLRTFWGGKVKVVTVHLGHIGDPGTSLLSRWMVPTYQMAARKIVRSILSRDVPRELNYTLLYCIIYKYILAFVPDIIYFWLFRLLIRLISLSKHIRV